MKYLGTILVTGDTVTGDSVDDCRRAIADSASLSTERVHVRFDRDVYRVFEREGAFVPFATIREVPDEQERRIIDALPFVGAEHVPPPDAQAQVWARIAADPRTKPRPWYRRLSRGAQIRIIASVAVTVLAWLVAILLSGCSPEPAPARGWAVSDQDENDDDTEAERTPDPREVFYDERISPLMTQISALCKEGRINMAAQFALGPHPTEDGPLLCTTCLVFDDDEEGKAHVTKVARTMKPPAVPFFAFTITSTKATP